MRSAGRAAGEMRPLEFELSIARYAEGSCLVKLGHTQVRCTASRKDGAPKWKQNGGPARAQSGWITAEYAMLPRATHERTTREKGGTGAARSQEIQRMIGRCVRGAIDMDAMGPMTLDLDCDVMQADGGTRCAAIAGAWLATWQACHFLTSEGVLRSNPIKHKVCAISCGVVEGELVLDLDYSEDSTADFDATFVFASTGDLVEVAAPADKRPFSRQELNAAIDLAAGGAAQIFAAMDKIVS